ncbi:hypothetical protein LIER_05547 [Lithospermum erythrorhizon]|uniref:Uncharacterized protein n=1 Tax=Lithospermum erythrorhizon TaxID=34254 RepID=A0AAV3P3L6_LITER
MDLSHDDRLEAKPSSSRAEPSNSVHGERIFLSFGTRHIEAQFGRLIFQSTVEPDQTELNLVPRTDQKIEIIAFIEGLRMRKFNESFMKKRSSRLEEVKEWAYKYIQIEEARKRQRKDMESVQ